MTGEQLFFQVHHGTCYEELVFMCALQGHSGSNLHISTASHEKLEKVYAQYLYFLGVSAIEGSIKSGRLVPGGFGQIESRRAAYFSLVPPLALQT